jgi:hypothetical protein
MSTQLQTVIEACRGVSEAVKHVSGAYLMIRMQKNESFIDVCCRSRATSQHSQVLLLLLDKKHASMQPVSKPCCWGSNDNKRHDWT